MKNFNTTYILKICAFVILLFMGFSSCKKEKPKKLIFDEYGLPIITKSGGNYYGYLLDSRPIWLHDPKKIRGNIKATYWSKEEKFAFYGSYEKDNDSYSLEIEINAALKEGQYYVLTDPINNNYVQLYKGIPYDGFPFPSTQMIGYDSYDSEPGFIKIEHINEKNKTISASFEVKVKKQWATETYTITKGRFDIVYKIK